MLQQVIQQQQQEQDEISSQISAQIFEFCDPELFQETLQNSEVTSSPNCCYDENSSYATNLSLPQDLETKYSTYQDNNGNTDTTIAPTPTTTSTTTTTSSTNTTTASNNTANINATTTSTNTTTTNNNNNSGNLSIIFDSQEEIDNDFSASIDFSPSPPFSVPPFLMNQQDQFDFSSVPTQMPLADVVEGFSQYHADPVPPLMSAPLSSVFEEDCLSSVPSYVPLNPSSPSCSFLGPNMGAYMSAGTMNGAVLSADSTGIFTNSILMASDLQQQDLEYQGDNGGIFCPDTLSRGFNPDDLQVLSGESQQLVSGAGNSTSLPTEIPMAEDPNIKVGKLSVEERKEKIHRYMKKRNERNFTKKIKYACRKTLADSRPRVRGRFAKNDDFGENHRPSGSNHEDDEDDEVVVKEEEDMVDSSDIFAHISGVNSFKCSYPIQSWI
ncbi:zinc finger protein CONSTANS-LIKE 4-like isoform X2 [Argentina anserina]|uniref:zinc finger protein CONSTANS-LIKE 4-like isoform X2 n=1 Tax=Argentina anserina TaxID=57926 RepID=UPI00217656C1|nr:zinc finger protein CONSTANS-LIKE 4-like isoform X2 [Potentilla anserina]